MYLVSCNSVAGPFPAFGSTADGISVGMRRWDRIGVPSLYQLRFGENTRLEPEAFSRTRHVLKIEVSKKFRTCGVLEHAFGFSNSHSLTRVWNPKRFLENGMF